MVNCVSLFSGGGGLDLGLEASGIRTKFATDIDPYSCSSLEKNKKYSIENKKGFLEQTEICCEDISTLKSKTILLKSGLRNKGIDLLSGGPPCQAFSVFGKRKGKQDPRGRLAYEYLRLLKELSPKAFIFENVFGLMTIEKGEIFKELIEKLSSPGDGLKYKLSIQRLNAVDYGVPQFRDRIFVIGSIEGIKLPEIKKICSEENNLFNKLIPWRTVSDGLRNLPKIESNKLKNHKGRNHSQRIINRYSSMHYGERDKHTRINKLDPKRPSYTIIVGSDAGGGKGHIHPFIPREVTPRESARMQCFPDWWEFSGKGRHPIRQVGNAVPTLLAASIGRELLFSIFNQQPRKLSQITNLLSQEHLFKNSEREFLQEFDHRDLSIQTHPPKEVLTPYPQLNTG